MAVLIFKIVPGSDNFEDERALDTNVVNIYIVSNMGSNNSLGKFEHVVLTAVEVLRDKAYGRAICRRVAELIGDPDLNPGGVYVTLERLTEKGLLTSWMADPTPERGGRSKRYYKLQRAGARALGESRAALERVHEGLGEDWSAKEWKPVK